MIAYSAVLSLSAAPQAAVATAARAEHVAIKATDIDRSADFCREALGLRLIRTQLKNRR